MYCPTNFPREFDLSTRLEILKGLSPNIHSAAPSRFGDMKAGPGHLLPQAFQRGQRS